MFKVGDLVKIKPTLSIRIRLGNSNRFCGIILKTWTAYRHPCRTPYVNTIVRCFNGTEIEVPTWAMEPLRDAK